MTAQEFIKKYPDSEVNENCLEDVACPHCGNRSRFRISAVTTFTMTDAGEDDHSDIEYDYNSYAHCEECNTPGVYSEFMVDGLDDLLRQAADRAAEQTETPTDEPCPVCFREEDGKWFTPCPSDDCPSHDKTV